MYCFHACRWYAQAPHIHAFDTLSKRAFQAHNTYISPPFPLPMEHFTLTPPSFTHSTPFNFPPSLSNVGDVSDRAHVHTYSPCHTPLLLLPPNTHHRTLIASLASFNSSFSYSRSLSSATCLCAGGAGVHQLPGCTVCPPVGHLLSGLLWTCKPLDCTYAWAISFHSHSSLQSHFSLHHTGWFFFQGKVVLFSPSAYLLSLQLVSIPCRANWVKCGLKPRL